MISKVLQLLCIIPLFAAGPASGGEYPGNPAGKDALDTHIGAGALALYPVYFEQPYVGYQLYWSMPPSEAKYFYPGFEEKNIGMEISFTSVKLTELRNFIDASVVFHKYLRNRKDHPNRDVVYVGAGIGLLSIRWETEVAAYRDVSYILEMGYEYRIWETLIVTLKAQARYLEAGPINFSGGGVLVSVGWKYN